MPIPLLTDRLSPHFHSLSDLCIFPPTSDPATLLANLSGDFAAQMTALFPGEWAWVALVTPLPTRQVW